MFFNSNTWMVLKVFAGLGNSYNSGHMETRGYKVQVQEEE